MKNTKLIKRQRMENSKPTIFCGVYHEMKEEEKNNFIKMMSEDGKYNVVFDGGNTIPKLVEMSLPFIDLKSDSDNNF